MLPCAPLGSSTFSVNVVWRKSTNEATFQSHSTCSSLPPVSSTLYSYPPCISYSWKATYFSLMLINDGLPVTASAYTDTLHPCQDQSVLRYPQGMLGRMPSHDTACHMSPMTLPVGWASTHVCELGACSQNMFISDTYQLT